MTYREWVQALLREHKSSRRWGVRCSGCWACDVLPDVTDADRQRCKDLSLGAPGTLSGGFDGHHVIPQQVLRRELNGGLDAALFDTRIGVPLRRWHHDQIERRMVRIPRHALPIGVEEIAEELGLGWYLDRTFGAVR